MGLIREPDGVDFVIQRKPMTQEGIAEMQAWIRQQELIEKAERDRLAKELLALPLDDRAQSAHWLIDNLNATAEPSSSSPMNPPRVASPANGTKKNRSSKKSVTATQL